MQDTDNSNAITCYPEINDVMAHAAAAISWPNMGATLCLLWGYGQDRTHGFQGQGIADCLLLAPLPFGVAPDIG